MLIAQILLLAGLSLAFRLLLRWPRAAAARGWGIYAASILCLYWLQPAAPIRYMDFWLPTATLALAVLGWLLTAPSGERLTRQTLAAGGVLAGLVLAVGLTRYLGEGDLLLATRPPALPQVLVGLAGAALLLTGLGALLWRSERLLRLLLAGAIVLLVALLVVLKTPALALRSAQGLRALMGQDPGLAAAQELRWLGFSYICFRLIHTLRDRQTGRLPAADLQTYLSYAIFFPALVAGPIDRLERFQQDFCAPGIEVSERFTADMTEAARRLVTGLVKKFVLADTFALVALNPQNALQARGAGWLWLMVYFYAFQIYFDFSGYTDIAIGLGRILGITLPENFAAPYRKPNLTQFWNSWHMSLTLWFRAYFFNPLVRAMRGARVKASPVVVLLVSQLSTMLLIGLWHGVTWNFAIWGLWHGAGMFAQNRWTEWVRPRLAARSLSPAVERGLRVFSTLLTFHYVALGWVWFVLPAPAMAGQVLLRLAGVGYSP